MSMPPTRTAWPSGRTLALLPALVVAGCGADAGPAGPSGPQGTAGPQGPPGPGQTPSISAISPLNVFLEHEDTIVLSGSGTDWGTGTTVDLGAGVAVNQLTVASPTALVALVEADSTATLGPRTVTVRSDADTATFENAFRVEAPLDIEFTGSFVPGGRIIGDVSLANGERPFPEPGSPFQIRTYSPEAPAEGSVGVESADEAELRYLLPLDAGPGPTRFVVEELLQGTKWRSAPFEMPAPDVVPGPYGSSVSAQVSEAGASVVYSVPAQAGQMVALTVSSPTGGFGHSLILPDSAHESVGQTFYAFGSDTWFTTVYEFLGGGSPPFAYTFQIDTMTVAPPTIDETPTTGSQSGLLLTDVYAVDLVAGEELTVALEDGPTDTCATIDAAVFVRDPSGHAIRSEIGGCVTVTTDPVATTGTYAVFVAPNPGCGCSFDYAVTATKN